MNKILDFVVEHTLSVSGQADTFLLIGFAVVAAFLLLNILLNPYAALNKKTKKASKVLVCSLQMRRSVPLGSLKLPAQYFDGFQNYRNSQSRFPSEFIAFKEKKHRAYGKILTMIYILGSGALAAANGIKLGFTENTVVLIFGLIIFYLAVRGLLEIFFALKTLKAKKVYKQFGRNLDMTFGERYFAGTNAILSDETCLDRDIDDTIAKIEFFKASGINPSTAKEVAALLSNEKLNKPRTHEQQKKLNAALNGLLQTLSASAQKQNNAGTQVM